MAEFGENNDALDDIRLDGENSDAGEKKDVLTDCVGEATVGGSCA